MSIPLGRTYRTPEHSIDLLFVDRWSPRAMSGEEVSEAELRSLFEAARWAPSSGNRQPWRFLYARRGTPHWPAFFDLLVPRNQTWCQRAGALLVLVAKTTNDDGTPLRVHAFDCGAAWENLALQGARMGLVVHGLAGFDLPRATTALRVPADHAVQIMIAVGRPGPKEDLPADLQEREMPNQRRPVSDWAREGTF